MRAGSPSVSAVGRPPGHRCTADAPRAMPAANRRTPTRKPRQPIPGPLDSFADHSPVRAGVCYSTSYRLGFLPTGAVMAVNVQEINRLVRDLRAGLGPLYAEIEKVIVGQRAMIDRILIGLLTGGHILLEGVPGLAKTLAVRSLAQALQLIFHRIQFT